MNKAKLPGVIFLLLLSIASCFGSSYDPLQIEPSKNGQQNDLSVYDKKRSRGIPIRVYLPDRSDPAPVVLFSHGLGGTKEGSSYLGAHWSSRGYAVVFLQHAGSDDSVWKSQARGQRMAAMKQAASLENLLLRVKDVSAVLDQLEAWNKENGNKLFGRLDMSRIGMSGHSFGAVTTQAVSGQSYSGGGQRFTDRRIRAAIMFSPSIPRAGSPSVAFGSVSIPWMLMTGTKDTAPIGHTDVASRLNVYPNLPAGSKYEVVLDRAEHSAFSERALPKDSEPRNPNHHRVVLALSTAFWDAYLSDDVQARAWLDGDGPNSVLEEKDKWQYK